jgi:hypothetical protein
VEQYVELRRTDSEQAKEGRTILTARQLLSILRMAQSLARIQFMPEVTEDHVKEAVRLVEASKASIVTVKESTAPTDPTSQIFEAIKAKFNSERSISLKYVKCPGGLAMTCRSSVVLWHAGTAWCKNLLHGRASACSSWKRVSLRTLRSMCGA